MTTRKIEKWKAGVGTALGPAMMNNTSSGSKNNKKNKKNKKKKISTNNRNNSYTSISKEENKYHTNNSSNNNDDDKSLSLDEEDILSIKTDDNTDDNIEVLGTKRANRTHDKEDATDTTKKKFPKLDDHHVSINTESSNDEHNKTNSKKNYSNLNHIDPTICTKTSLNANLEMAFVEKMLTTTIIDRVKLEMQTVVKQLTTISNVVEDIEKNIDLMKKRISKLEDKEVNIVDTKHMKKHKIKTQIDDDLSYESEESNIETLNDNLVDYTSSIDHNTENEYASPYNIYYYLLARSFGLPLLKSIKHVSAWLRPYEGTYCSAIQGVYESITLSDCKVFNKKVVLPEYCFGRVKQDKARRWYVITLDTAITLLIAIKNYLASLPQHKDHHILYDASYFNRFNNAIAELKLQISNDKKNNEYLDKIAHIEELSASIKKYLTSRNSSNKNIK